MLRTASSGPVSRCFTARIRTVVSGKAFSRGAGALDRVASMSPGSEDPKSDRSPSVAT
jgi:hypothetical protein